MKHFVSNMNANGWRRLLAILAVAALFTVAAAPAGAAGNTSGSCPNAKDLGDFLSADNVAATFSTDTTTKITTYKFISLTNENPVGGVPGLVKYCVYPTQDLAPTDIHVEATGADGELWLSSLSKRNFGFVRPAGNASNIPLDGTTTTMGTATWGTVPTDQTILLHIADAAKCHSLYGGDVTTCFVKPAAVCAAGDTTLAYNAMPFGVVNCGPPSLAFEGTATNEFGDNVTLATGSAGTKSVQLDVVFNSYACSDSGSWDGVKNSVPAPCVTTPGTSFTIDVTANIYDPSGAGGLTTPIATVTQPQTFAYRPSADPVNCTAADGNDPAQWFNPLKFGGVGGCQYSIVEVHTFTFPTAVPLPNTVVWSVAFNTTHSGYDPIGITSCNDNLNNPGCGYDSLNVGFMSFTGAPYSGMDVDEDLADRSWWSPGYPPPFDSGILQLFQSESGYTGIRPLGRIITK